MTPEDLDIVEQSWSALRGRRAAILLALTRRFDATAPFDATVPSSIEAAHRAEWLFCAVEELVELLSVPSRLADRARDLGETWPDPLTAPSYAVEGRAWMGAAGDCLATWSDRTAAAWRHAWLLLSEVLAAETLSPFADCPPPPAGVGEVGGSSGEGVLPTVTALPPSP